MAVDSIGSIQENRIKYAKYFSDKQNGDLSVDDFYTLLLAEMTNQDPLEPTSNTEFISQMATFTSMRSQQDALYYSNASYASSLVGKTVLVATASGSKLNTITGVVSNINLSGKTFTVSVNGKEYDLKNIMKIVSDTDTSSETTSKIGTDGAYATSLIGKRVTISAATSSGSTVYEQGTVDSIEVKDGQFSVIVNGLSYKLGDVIKVQNENTASTSKPETAESIAAADTNSKTDSSEKTDSAETQPADDKTDKTDKAEAADNAQPEKSAAAKIPNADKTNQADIQDLTDEKENLIELFS